MRKLVSAIIFCLTLGQVRAVEYELAAYDFVWDTALTEYVTHYQFLVKRTYDSATVWDSGSIANTGNDANQTLSVPEYNNGATPFSWQLHRRQYNGPLLGSYWTDYGVVDSGTGTEAEGDFSQFDIYLGVRNSSNKSANYTVESWDCADPGNVARQRSTSFRLSPGEETSVHIRETFSFCYRVLRQEDSTEIDGAMITPPIEEVETGTSEETEVEVEPEPVMEVDAPGQDTQPPDATPDAERVEAPDTIAEADQNAEARATDARSDADRVAKTVAGVSNAVNNSTRELMAGLAGLKGAGSGQPGPGAEDDFEEENEEVGSHPASMTFEKMMQIGEDLGGIAGMWNFTVTTAALPEVGWNLPAALGGGSCILPFSDWNWLWATLRIAMTIPLLWHFLLLVLATIKATVS